MKASVNSISALTAIKFFLLREKYRHQQDIVKIEQDLAKLKDIVVPESLDITAWYEIDRGW